MQHGWDAHRRATATGIPAGEYFQADQLKPLELAFKTGKAGRVVAESKGGAIGSVDVGLASFHDPSRSISFALRNVRIIMNWDMDGDTRYEGNPWHFFLTTGGAPLGQSSIRLRWGSWGLGVAANTLVLDDVQVRWYIKKVLLVPVPQVKVAGRACAANSHSLEVMWSDTWHGFPMRASAPGECRWASFPFRWSAW